MITFVTCLNFANYRASDFIRSRKIAEYRLEDHLGTGSILCVEIIYRRKSVSGKRRFTQIFSDEQKTIERAYANRLRQATTLTPLL
jgi:hypothetical protein